MWSSFIYCQDIQEQLSAHNFSGTSCNLSISSGTIAILALERGCRDASRYRSAVLCRPSSEQVSERSILLSIIVAFLANRPYRTLVVAMFAESLLCHGGILAIQRVFFYTPWIFKFPMPEVWRLFTPFLLTGGGFSFVFDLYFSKQNQRD